MDLLMMMWTKYPWLRLMATSCLV